MFGYKKERGGYGDSVEEQVVDGGGGDVGEGIQSECGGGGGCEEGGEEGEEGEGLLYAVGYGSFLLPFFFPCWGGGKRASFCEGLMGERANEGAI